VCSSDLYWVESGCNASSTKIWARVPSAAAGTSIIYIYYGNAQATYNNSLGGSNTFVYFDDFEGYAAGSAPTGWTVYGGGAFSVQSADGSKVLRQDSDTGGGGGGTEYMETDAAYAISTPIVLEAETKGTSTANYEDGLYLFFRNLTGSNNLGVQYVAGGPGPSSRCVYVVYKAGTVCVDQGQFQSQPLWGRFEVRYSGSDIYYRSWKSPDRSSWTAVNSGQTLSYANDYSGSLKVRVDGSNGNVGNLIDNIRVRKYASPEPSALSGAEQTKGYRALVRRCGLKEESANVTAYQAGIPVGSCVSDLNGICSLEISSGTYDLMFAYADNSTAWKNGIAFG
jgi:hypothetical protein